MEKYSSRPEVEGVARLDPTSLLVVSLFLLALFLPEPSGLSFSAAISSCHMFHFTLPVLTKPEWWMKRFVSTCLVFFLNKISILFIMVPEVHNRTMSPAVEVSSLSGQSDLSFCACQES